MTNPAIANIHSELEVIDSELTTLSESNSAKDVTINTLRAEIDRLTQAPTPVPPVEIIGGPVSVNASVVANGTKRNLDSYNAYRDTNFLTVYTPSVNQKVSPANQYGAEAVIVNGIVQSVTDRQSNPGSFSTAIPSDGWVLSGHGSARDWILSNVKVNAKISWEERAVVTPPVETPPVTTPVPSGPGPKPFPSKARMLYFMCWTNSGSPKLATVPIGPGGVNVIALAFIQNDPMSLVGPASEGSNAAFDAEIIKARNRGANILLSIGGGGGHVNIYNRDQIVNYIVSVHKNRFPVDGIDWDIEGSTPMPVEHVVYICQKLKELIGKDFNITMAPNGSTIGAYIEVGKVLQSKGLLDAFGMQMYDAVVSYAAMRNRVDQYVAAGLPIEKWMMGNMIGSADVYWTVQECKDAMAYLNAKYPNIKGGYLWEAGRAGTNEWITWMVSKFPA